jgi:hypothetical protein
MRLAIGHAALAAPAGLFGGLGGSKLTVDFMKIFGAQIGRPLLGGFFAHRDEFQHTLHGHRGISQIHGEQGDTLVLKGRKGSIADL